VAPWCEERPGDGLITASYAHFIKGVAELPSLAPPLLHSRARHVSRSLAACIASVMTRV
jgi:hypothetical protein